MSARFWLDDEAWAVIEPLLPQNQPGARRVDDRRVISGIIHVLRSGCPWRDCPREYGPPTTIYNRFNRWSRRRIWQRLLRYARSDASTYCSEYDCVVLGRKPSSLRPSWLRRTGAFATTSVTSLRDPVRNAGWCLRG